MLSGERVREGHSFVVEASLPLPKVRICNRTMPERGGIIDVDLPWTNESFRRTLMLRIPLYAIPV